jgi:hypothetical protein
MTKGGIRLLGSSSLLFILVFTAITTTAIFSSSTPITFAQDITSFVSSFENLVKEVNDLSGSYHKETGKSENGQADNNTIITITDSYKPKYESLIDKAKALQPPKQFQNATDLYIKSLESELQSNNHFRNYLATNNATESELSNKLLSDSFTYESEAFKQLNSSGQFSIIP